MREIASPEILFILDTLPPSIKVCPGKIWSVHTYHNYINPNKNVSSKDCCTWWGFQYCVVCWVNFPCSIVNECVNVSRFNQFSHVYFRGANHGFEDLMVVVTEQMAFAWGFLIVVGLSFMPYDSYNVSKYNLNSNPLSYIKY